MHTSSIVFFLVNFLKRDPGSPLLLPSLFLFLLLPFLLLFTTSYSHITRKASALLLSLHLLCPQPTNPRTQVVVVVVVWRLAKSCCEL
jgi:hypothetical protein